MKITQTRERIKELEAKKASLKSIEAKEAICQEITYLKASIHTLEEQYEAMLARGVMSCYEYSLKDEGEYLIVSLYLNYTDKKERFNGLRFEFDNDNKNPRFSGEVRKLGEGAYLLPVDDCFDDLDHYIQAIDDEMTEGYLLVHDLLN